MSQSVVMQVGEVKRHGRIAAGWGAFSGLLCGIVIMGSIYQGIVARERHAIAELMACNPETGEQAILRRDAGGKLTCEKALLRQTVRVEPR